MLESVENNLEEARESEAIPEKNDKEHGIDREEKN